MTMQSSLPGRWVGALALTMGAALTYAEIALGPLRVLALPLAVYGAASVTGWSRNDAAAIAAGSGLVGFFSMLTVRHGPVALVAFAVVVVAALRPQGRRTLGYRLLVLAVWLLASIDVGAWWTLLLVPSIVAAADDLARLTASSVPELSRGGAASARHEPAVAAAGQIAPATSAEHDARARSGASAALALASLACVLLVAFGFFATTGSIAPLLVTFAAAAGGAVLAIRSFRTDPVRATAALVLAAIPLAFIGFVVLIVLGGGLAIGS
jgi:hypothetical protein